MGLEPQKGYHNAAFGSFRTDLMKATNGRDVDIVLNSSAGEFLHASWECVALFGKVIELGKRDFLIYRMLNLKPSTGNRAFFGVWTCYHLWNRAWNC